VFIDMEALVAEYVVLRDIKKAKTEAFKEAMQIELQGRMDEIEETILGFLNASNQKNAKTTAGTATRVEDVSVTIKDADTFRRHVIGTQSWEMLDWRANKTAANQLADAGVDLDALGLNRSVMYSVQVRRASKNG